MRSLSLLLLALALATCGDAPAEPPAPPADVAEVIVLTHQTYATPVPLAEALAAVEGTTVQTDADGTQRVRLGNDVELVAYPDHDRIVQRLQASPAPDAALFLISSADGSFEQHDQQVALAQEAGVPIAHAVMGHLHLIDDLELLDLMEQFDVGETLTEAGYPGVPVIRVSAVEALDGDASDRQALSTIAEAARQAARR